MATDCQSATDSVPQVGQPFNPWRGACGFYPPAIVSRIPSRDLRDGPKRLYERLVRFPGRDSLCHPTEPTLAAELGKKDRQIRSDRTALKRFGLIRWKVTGLGRGKSTRTYYEFLYHPIFVQAYDRQYDATPNEVPTGSPTVLRPAGLGHYDRQAPAAKFCTENSVRKKRASGYRTARCHGTGRRT